MGVGLERMDNKSDKEIKQLAEGDAFCILPWIHMHPWPQGKVFPCCLSNTTADDVVGDLNRRRGQISTQELRGNATVITAMVPLANMFGYINSLRSMSQGRAQYSMFFDHYDKVPQNVQDEVTKKMA